MFKLKKHSFYCYQSLSFYKYVDIQNALVSSNIFGEKSYKYFIGYSHAHDDYKVEVMQCI